MRAILVILVVFLIGKDLAYAPFPYVLRAVAQGLCLAAGIVAVLPHLSESFFYRYWPVLGYLTVLMVTVPLAKFPLFVLLQVMSLASALMFFMAYFEGQENQGLRNVSPLSISVVAMYGLACLLSLAFLKLNHNMAYEAQFTGNVAGYELRFRGMFSKAGMMGAASGLLVGLASICVKRPIIKLVLFVSGLICLVLTQSRTFWIAALLAGMLTIWRHYPHFKRFVIAATITGVLAAIAVLALNLRLNVDGAEKFARLDTINNLSGRTALWTEALSGLGERPWFGYGFTLGAMGLPGNQFDGVTVDSVQTPTKISRETLHNGYIQSALDSGLIGLFFYLMTMCISLLRLLRNDSGKNYPEALYVLVFLIVANGAESVIYSGAVFQSICFWAFAIFSLGLGEQQWHSVQQMPMLSKTNQLPNLMR